MKTCCFTGHRAVPAADRPFVEKQTARAIHQLIGDGFVTFVSGGALGFDLLAAETVLRAKTVYPAVRLKMVLPCRNQTERWSVADRARYDAILAAADEVMYTAEAYHRGCMHVRNRAMVDISDGCICYMTAATGGTAYTVGYAKEKGIPIFNVARAAQTPF